MVVGAARVLLQASTVARDAGPVTGHLVVIRDAWTVSWGARLFRRIALATDHEFASQG